MGRVQSWGCTIPCFKMMQHLLLVWHYLWNITSFFPYCTWRQLEGVVFAHLRFCKSCLVVSCSMACCLRVLKWKVSLEHALSHTLLGLRIGTRHPNFRFGLWRESFILQVMQQKIKGHLASLWSLVVSTIGCCFACYQPWGPDTWSWHQAWSAWYTHAGSPFLSSENPFGALSFLTWAGPQWKNRFLCFFGPSCGTLPDNLFEPKTLAGGSELSFREFCDMDVLSKKMLAEDPLLAPGPNAVQKRWGVWRFFLASPPTPQCSNPQGKTTGAQQWQGILDHRSPGGLIKIINPLFHVLRAS